MKNQLYIVDYDRSELCDEIDMIIDVEQNWLDWIGNLSKLDHSMMISGDIDCESKIIERIIKAEELAPESEKSVVR